MGKIKVVLFKKKYFYQIFFILTFLIFSGNAYAANRYWVAADDGTTKYYHDPANWSHISGGAGGKSAPKLNDRVFFDDGSTVDCVMHKKKSKAKVLKILSSYTGTVNLNGKTLIVAENIALYGTLSLPANSILQTKKKTSYIYNGGTLSAENAKKIDIFSVLDIQSGGTFLAPSTGQLFFRGGFRNYGTFTHNNGTVFFGPRDNSYQVVTSGTGTGKDFYNVTKLGAKSFKMNGNMQVNNFKIQRGKWDVFGNNMFVKGNWTTYVGNRFKDSKTGIVSTVTFNGSGNQTILANHTNSIPSFENLTISNTGGVVSLSTKDVDIDNTLTIDSGATLDIAGINLDTSTLDNSGNFQLQGDETVNISTMENSGTVTYDGTGSYTELEVGDSYYNLTFNSSGTYALDNNLDVNGALTITDGSLDVSTDNRSINVAGNWTNNDIFNSRSGTVTFDGTSTITSGGITNNTQDFYNVILSGSAGTQSTNHVDVDNNFTISSSGTWDTGGLCLFVGGTTNTGSGTLTNTTTPTVTFSPANSADDVQATANITITFNHAVRNTDNSALTNSNVDSLITLKQNNSSGSDIDFDATIDSDKKVITINPDSNFSSEQTVYVAIGATVEETPCGQVILMQGYLMQQL